LREPRVSRGIHTWDDVSKSREMHPAIPLVGPVATVDCPKTRQDAKLENPLGRRQALDDKRKPEFY
jgi:hypothetical protein